MPRPELQGPLAAEPVAERPRRQQQAGEHERVAVDHPLELAVGGVEVAHERGQRHVEDGVVEGDHHEAQAEHQQDPPAACVDPFGGRHVGFLLAVERISETDESLNGSDRRHDGLVHRHDVGHMRDRRSDQTVRTMHISITVPVGDPRRAPGLFAEIEQAGYDRAFSFESDHDPFIPLAAAAATTDHLQLGTAVAIGFARNPMVLANIGHDMQLLTEGRFVLGLGSQIRPHIENRFSEAWSRPAARMREMVSAVRAIWERWEGNAPLDFQGEFYRHTLMTPGVRPRPQRVRPAADLRGRLRPADGGRGR